MIQRCEVLKRAIGSEVDHINSYLRFWRCGSYIRLLRKTKRCDLDHTLHYNMEFVVM